MAYKPKILALNEGGTNASLTASNGGILYSTASAGAILAGTATANKVLMSGSSTTPSWSTPTFPNASATSGKAIVSDGTNWIASTPTFPNASATTGKIIISDGTNWIASTPTYPAAASTSGNVLTSDGTNWTSAAGGIPKTGSTTDRAIATWNGTTGGGLFNNSTTNIDSTGRQTNTAQVSFTAYNSGNFANATGDGTAYNPIFDSVIQNFGTNYSTSTGIFTAPITGRYLFTVVYALSGIGASHTQGLFDIPISTTGQVRLGKNNPATCRDLTDSQLYVCGNLMLQLSAAQTVKLEIKVSGSTKTVNVLGTISGTIFSGQLLC